MKNHTLRCAWRKDSLVLRTPIPGTFHVLGTQVEGITVVEQTKTCPTLGCLLFGLCFFFLHIGPNNKDAVQCQ